LLLPGEVANADFKYLMTGPVTGRCGGLGGVFEFVDDFFEHDMAIEKMISAKRIIERSL